jgi:hypothetical protein
METLSNKTEGKTKSKIERRCEEWFKEDGSDQLETKDTGEEAMERNNWTSQNSQRVGELKEEEYRAAIFNLDIPLCFVASCSVKYTTLFRLPQNNFLVYIHILSFTVFRSVFVTL